MDDNKIKKSYALESIKTPIVFKTLVSVSVYLAIALFITLFLPWRQTVTGVGEVIVFSPMNRP